MTEAKVIAETLGVTMGNVEEKVLVDAFGDTPKEEEPETLKYTVADVMTEALIDCGLRKLENTWVGKAETLY